MTTISEVRTAFEEVVRCLSYAQTSPWPEDAIHVVETWLDAQPAAPEPDWTNAPEWAMYTALDADGYRVWCEAPLEPADYGEWDIHGRFRINRVPPTTNYDWRTTLRRRPEPTERWEPVEDMPESRCGCVDKECTRYIGMERSSLWIEDEGEYLSAWLPAGYALCHRVEVTP